jgi:hypothetical protein
MPVSYEVVMTAKEIWEYATRNIGKYVKESDTLRLSSDAEESQDITTLTKIKEIRVYHSGRMRMKFDLRIAGPTVAEGQIYINGVAVGTLRSTTSTAYVTFSEDLDVDDGDLVQLYTRNLAAGYPVYCRNFRLYFDCDYWGRVIS